MGCRAECDFLGVHHSCDLEEGHHGPHRDDRFEMDDESFRSFEWMDVQKPNTDMKEASARWYETQTGRPMGGSGG